MVVDNTEDIAILPAPEVVAEGDLRDKNQITVPKPVVDAIGLHRGDRLVFRVDPHIPGLVHMQLLPRSYAGILAGVYGTPEEAHAYLQEEEEAWGE